MPLPPIPQKKVESGIAGALLPGGREDKGEKVKRIAVVAPSCPLNAGAADRLTGIAAARGDCELRIHPQCFLAEGHFAGSDAQRLAAFREVVADPEIDAVWFARGGYGSNRIAEQAATKLPAPALGKLFMAYSDGGFLLAALHKAGCEVAHGPMAQDVLREGGEAAVHRALDWIIRRDASTLEPQLHAPALAFNLTVLSNLLGTAMEPDFSGVDLLIEEVSEHHYRIDRLMFHVSSSANVRRAARLRLGRASDIPPNDVDFGCDEETIVADWCARSGIPFGGRADIGHDAQNKVVPFGRAGPPSLS
jgi:muramoyltetrapeptide carboxypeptidase